MKRKITAIDISCNHDFTMFSIFRRTPESRHKAKEDIKARAQSSDQQLPQLFLCPEGTNTNRKVLIQFKVQITDTSI